MKIEEARSILGLKPGEEARTHLSEFEAARELIAEMVRSAPNDTIAMRYQEGLMEFDRALASVREELARVKEAAEAAEAVEAVEAVETAEATEVVEAVEAVETAEATEVAETAEAVEVVETEKEAAPVGEMVPPPESPERLPVPPPDSLIEDVARLSSPVEVPKLEKPSVLEPPFQAEELAGPVEVFEVVADAVLVLPPASVPAEPAEPPPSVPVEPPLVVSASPGLVFGPFWEPPRVAEQGETVPMPERVESTETVPQQLEALEPERGTPVPPLSAPPPVASAVPPVPVLETVLEAPLAEEPAGIQETGEIPRGEGSVSTENDDEEALAAKWQGGRRRRFPVGAVVLALLVVAVGGGWLWMRVQTDMRLQRQGRISFLERQGAKFVENRRWDEAGAAFAEIDELDPGSPLGALGRRSIEAGMAEEHNQFLAYWQGEALAAFEAGRWEDAERAIRTVVAKVPGNPEMVALERRISEERRLRERAARLDKGRKAVEANRWDDAAGAARELLDIQPGDREAGELLVAANAGRERERENRGRARELLGKAKQRDTGEFDPEALEWIREAARLAPGDPEVAALYQKLSGYTRTLRVPGDHESVGAAITAARPRDRIIVGKGVWKEALVIDRMVEIEGAGAAETVFECPAADGPVATFGPEAAGVRVTGVGFRHVSFAGGKERFSVAVVRGGLVQFEACRFLDASGHGLAVIGGGIVVATACRFEGNGWDGAAVYGEGSRLEVTDSQAVDNIEHGIDAWNGATLVVRGTLARGNGRNGICVATPGEVTVDRNKVEGNREFGIVVAAGKGGRVSANTAERNELGGLAFHRQARGLEIRGNIASRNEGPGVVFDEGFAAGAMEGNEARGNGGTKQVLEGVKLDATIEAGSGN